MAELLLLLFGIAFATIGGTGYAIFGPLTVRHLMDRGLDGEVDGSSLSRAGLAWILAGRYRRHADANLRRLAVPARIMLVLLLSGLALFATWWLLTQR